MSDFKNQAEVWRYLLESEENKVEYVSSILGIKDGSLWDYNRGEISGYSFNSYGSVSKYKELKTVEIKAWAVVEPCGNYVIHHSPPKYMVDTNKLISLTKTVELE